MPFDPELRFTDAGRLAESGPPGWAAAEIGRALVETRRHAGAEIVVTSPEEAGAEVAAAAESFALWRDGDRIGVAGRDERGLVYALTELADRARHATGPDPFAGPFPLAEAPTARIRSMARLFCSDVEDLPWFHDRQGWRDYLTLLATSRFNRFSLTLGMGYNYPYHNPWIRDVYFYFPYPYLFDMPGYDVSVRELPDEERAQNLETLKFIAQETARRGMEFQLALWTQRYDFDDVPNANYTVDGVTDANLAPYCRDAITRLLTEVPEITGLTFRVHVEGGIPEGDYDFWEAAFQGVAAAGRPVEIDMHGKGLDDTTLRLGRATGMPITASPKYMGEHMGLAYHQSSIRTREFPPEEAKSAREKLSEGSRKFLRYSYGDLLKTDKDYKVLYRIWAGTQRVLTWGDPALAGGYGRLSMFAGSDGVEWCEPLSFKGRMGLGVPGQRFNYQEQGLAPRRDWEKYAYTYRVWGRGLYNPDGPDDGWMRHLRSTCGDAAGPCAAALAPASRVLPLVSLTHAPSASNNHYWPEIYTNLALFEGNGKTAYAFDMDAPVRFGNAPTFDSELFATPREWVEALLRGEDEHRYTPFDVALRLSGLADEVDAGLAAARDCADGLRPETRRILLDSEILAGIARFFAERFRAAVWAELMIATGATELIAPVMDHARRAVDAWDRIAGLSRDVYADDLTYGPQSWLRGSWHARQAEMRAEILDLEARRSLGRTESLALTPEGARAAEAIRDWRPVVQGEDVTVPGTFARGEPVQVRYAGPADAAPVLRFRPVDQSQLWQAVAMQQDGDGWRAEIPGGATDTDYHLQCFVSVTAGGVPALCPGLDADLANQPYWLVRQT